MKAVISLKLNEMNNADVLVESDKYTTLMTNNPYFKAPEIVAQVTKVKTANTALRTVMSQPMSDTKTSTVLKCRDALNRELTKLKNMVQDAANDPAVLDIDRELIVHSAGMTLKASKPSVQHVFTVKHGKVSGSVVLSAKGGANAHEWQYTDDVDTFINREALDTTTIAKITVSGLQRGKEYAFFHKPVVANEKTDWEDPIIFLVN